MTQEEQYLFSGALELECAGHLDKTDFDQLGQAMMVEDGIRRTEFGLVRRLSAPFSTQEIGQTMM